MIRIVCLGKIKEPYIAQGIQEFTKRLQRHCKVEMVELKDAKVLDTQQALKEEASQLEKYIRPPYFLLDEHGKTCSSQEFASLLKKYEMDTLTFVIGSAHGFHEILKKKGQLLSLSPMTWTHQMARLLLIEQVYRGICINKNIPYHKE